ncbi:MAG: M48 family metalloprotease, partial [Candidatus Thorarchaeota archaeon]
VLSELNLLDFFLNIYFVLIVVNWIIYFISGPILDFMLGIKRIRDEDVLKIVEEIKTNIGIKGKIKAGFGKYPIINAMAYGSFLDKRIAIISDDLTTIPRDEIKGIIAHELSHTKGKHTLLLTILTSVDLIVRMFLGIPATFYDYTFGNPQIPLFSCILLNFGIYLILFIFVRILEGKADKRTKKTGYGRELIKALYNLESFYSTGREIGLNTMLLCEEKITDYNKIINYIDTAEYLNSSIIKPSKMALISNLLNSHPPTFYRIAAVLDDTLTPSKEALLPFICLKNSNRKKYATLFRKSREEFRKIAHNKFKEQFNIEDFSDYLDKIKRKEIYKLDIGKQFLFKHKIDAKYKLGTLLDVKFQDDICDKDLYLINNSITNDLEKLNASYYEKFQVSVGDQYYFEKEGLLKLTNIEFNQDKDNAKLSFLNEQQNKIIKNLTKTKLPNPISLIKELKNTDVFFKLKGGLKIYTCEKVNIVPDIKKSVLELREKDNNTDKIKVKLDDLIIKPRSIYLIFRRSKLSRNDELAFINWIKSKQLRTYIQLKKPVNNTEIGYIIDLNLRFKTQGNDTKEEFNEKESHLNIRNIFDKHIKIQYNTIELIYFEYKTISLQNKNDTSVFTKIGYKLLKRFKPHKIIYL